MEGAGDWPGAYRGVRQGHLSAEPGPPMEQETTDPSPKHLVNWCL